MISTSRNGLGVDFPMNLFFSTVVFKCLTIHSLTHPIAPYGPLLTVLDALGSGYNYD